MKKLLITILALAFVFGITSTAKAVLLVPGGSVAPTGAASPGTTLVTSLTLPINIQGSTGTLWQWVRQGPLGLVFEYQFQMDNGGNIYLNRLSATDYTGFTTYVDAVSGTGNESPNPIDRDPTGRTVGFSFPGWVGPNDTSELLWVHTNAPSYKIDDVYLQDGGQTTFRVYGPALPEPSSLLLLGMGILGLFRLGRRKA